MDTTNASGDAGVDGAAKAAGENPGGGDTGLVMPSIGLGEKAGAVADGDAAAKTSDKPGDAAAPDGEAAAPGKFAEAGDGAEAAASAKPIALKVAQGFEHVSLDGLRDIAKAANLAPEVAQRVADEVVARVQADRAHVARQYVAQVQGDIAALQARPGFAAERELVNRFLIERARPEMRAFLNASGAGVRPLVFSFLLDLARSNASDVLRKVGSSAADTNAADRALRDDYASMFTADGG